MAHLISSGPKVTLDTNNFSFIEHVTIKLSLVQFDNYSLFQTALKINKKKPASGETSYATIIHISTILLCSVTSHRHFNTTEFSI